MSLTLLRAGTWALKFFNMLAHQIDSRVKIWRCKPSHRMYGEIRCGGQPGSNVVQEVIVNSSMKPTFHWSYMFKFSRLDPSFIGKVPSFYGFIWKVLITYVSSLMFGVTGSWCQYSPPDTIYTLYLWFSFLFFFSPKYVGLGICLLAEEEMKIIDIKSPSTLLSFSHKSNQPIWFNMRLNLRGHCS